MNMTGRRKPEEPEGATCRGLWRSCTASGRQVGEDHTVRDERCPHRLQAGEALTPLLTTAKSGSTYTIFAGRMGVRLRAAI